MDDQEQQPSLHLLKAGSALTVEQLTALFEKLTGRTPSQEELDSARAELEKTHDQSSQ